MFDFLNKLFKTMQPEKNGAPFSDIKKEEPNPGESLPRESEHKDDPADKSKSDSGGPKYDDVRKRFPQLLEIMTNYLEEAIPGDKITAPGNQVFISAEVYERYIDKIYLNISQASDGHMTLKIDAGRRGSDALVGQYFFEAGRTKEEIFRFLRSPEMPDILDKTINELDKEYRNR